MPMIAKLSDNSFAFTRLKSAGTSLRLVRAPAPPKSTITHGPVGLPDCSYSLSRFNNAAVGMGRSTLAGASYRRSVASIGVPEELAFLSLASEYVSVRRHLMPHS